MLQRNPFYSVLALVVHLLALAVLFLLLRAEFLAAAQVIVYAGAVMVLYVFVVSQLAFLDYRSLRHLLPFGFQHMQCMGLCGSDIGRRSARGAQLSG